MTLLKDFNCGVYVQLRLKERCNLVLVGSISYTMRYRLLGHT